MIIESTNFDIGIVSSIKGAAKTIDVLTKQTNSDSIEEIIDEHNEMISANTERQDIFAKHGKEDEDDLLKELDKIETEMVKS